MSSVKRKDEILKATLEIIFKQGYHSLTIRSIARKINISEAAVYRHFESKEEILSEICNPIFTQNPFWNKNILKKDSFELLQQIMMQQLNILIDNPFLSAILFQEDIFGEYPKIKEKFNTHRLERERIIKEIIRKGQKDGIISLEVDAATFAILFMGSIRILVLKWRYSDFVYKIQAEAEKVIGQLFRFIKAQT